MATTTAKRPRQRRQPTADDLAKLGQFPPPTATSEQLAVENRLLAMDCANRYARNMQMPVADLETAAWVGLLKACRLFDAERINPHTGRPYALSSFAVPYIRGAMLQYVRDKVFAIKFPHCWRELGPKVRRLSQQGQSHEQICEQLTADGKAVTVADVAEILGSMKPTVELDYEPVIDRTEEQLLQREEDEEGERREQHAWAVLEEAYLKLHRSDREAIEEFWTNTRRIPIPHGPLQQLRNKVRALVGQHARGGVERMPLGFEVLATPTTRRTRRPTVVSDRGPDQLTAAAIQCDLFSMVIEPAEEAGEP